MLARQNERQKNIILQGEGIKQVEILKNKPEVLAAERSNLFSPMVESARPFKNTSPSVGRSSAARIFKSVVLPEPDSPMMATYSPRSTANVTFVSACTRLPPNRVVYTFFNPLTSKTAINKSPFSIR